jgi:hypothetical protein
MSRYILHSYYTCQGECQVLIWWNITDVLRGVRKVCPLRSVTFGETFSSLSHDSLFSPFNHELLFTTLKKSLCINHFENRYDFQVHKTTTIRISPDILFIVSFYILLIDLRKIRIIIIIHTTSNLIT